MKLYPYQRQAVEYHKAHHYSLNGSEMGCVAETTLVKFNRAKISRNIQIRDLYRRYKAGGWTPSIPTYVRGWNGTRVALLRLEDVIFSGVKEVFRVKLSCGKFIDATKDHEIFTERGWVAVEDLLTSDKVATDTLERHAKKADHLKSEKVPKLKYNLIQVGKHHPYGQRLGVRTDVKRIEIHRAIKEASINGLDLKTYQNTTRCKDGARNLQYIDPKQYHVHHINHNHKDHRPENLEVLTVRDHALIHSKQYENFGHGLLTWSQVEKIEPKGLKPTYDLKVEAPHHNFVANGIVVHNCGKTIMSLTTAKETGNKALVVGPAFLKKTWEDEAAEVGVEVYFVSYSMIHRMTVLEGNKFNFWIADEVHALKNPTAQRTQAFYSLLKACKPEYFIGMSGTPLKNRVMDLWTLIAFCMQNPKDTSGGKLEGELTKYHAFARHFCNVQELKIRGRRIPKYTTVKDERVPELKALLKDKFIRFQVKDVLKDLPAITRKFVPLDIISDGLDGELQETFDSYVTGHKANSTAKRQSALIKTGATIEYCKSLIEGGVNQLLIFTDHVESAHALKAVHEGAKVITGATPMLDRQNAVVQFQEGQVKVIVATIGSMSVGVTLTATNHVVFNDMSWVPSDNMQAEKRIHRIGQGKPCFVHLIESTPTDRYITKTLVAKMDTINKVIE